MAYDFKYIRTGTGELSGPSMIWQTEQALTQIGTYADEANTQADEALETANTALNKANNAAEAAERAQNTADTAQAAASHAQETADAAQVAADNAQDTADEALETAQKGVADAAKAQAAADKAQATADAAQDAADAAQLTADNAQNAADKAQDAADAAQQTANDALNAVSNSQGSANVAQDTADNALLVAQSTQQAFYEHVREYTPQIAKALGEFEADNTTVNFDNFTDSVKLYITSPDASITGPNGKVNSPFYLWNFTTDDRSSTAQFVYAANGLTYSRYGTIGQNDLVPGTDTYTLENNSKNAILTCNGVASGMTITKSGSLTNTWTASDTHNSYITGTWNIKGITNGTIDLNGVTIANLSDTGFYPTGQQLQEDNTSFVIEDMTYSADDGLTIKVTVQWLNIDSQISWDSWKVDTPAVDTPAVDNVTIKYNSSNELQAKDVAIGGNASDLASARGQIGDAKEMPNLDFNTLTTPGNYRITGNPTNGPSLPLNISGASIGSLIVAGIPGQNGRIFQIMISGSAVTWRTIQDSTGTTWSAWQQLFSGNKVGDGIRVTNGIISVPEMQGATASKAGTSGLVPPAAAGQHESFLTGGGEYKPALTKISNSVSTTDSTTAASATAVKSAYDAANERLPLSGGTLTGALRSKPGNIHVASTPSADEVDDALYLVDANGVVYANLQSTNYANGSMLVGLAVNTSVKGGSGGWQTLKIGADKTGKFISHVPTPDLSDASDNIANTVYVQENLKSYLKLAGGILTGDVTVPSVNGYQVVDHEVNGGWYFFPENFYNSGRNGRFLTKAGLKVQYGGVSGMSNVTQQVTFAEPFSTIPIVITTSESSGIEQITVPLGVTTTGFSLGHMSAGTQTRTVFKHWIAIGR